MKTFIYWGLFVLAIWGFSEWQKKQPKKAKTGFEKIEQDVIEYKSLGNYISDEGLKYETPFKLRMTYATDQKKVFVILKELSCKLEKSEAELFGRLSQLQFLDEWGNIVYRLKLVSKNTDRETGESYYPAERNALITQESRQYTDDEFTWYTVKTTKGYIKGITYDMWTKISKIDPFAYSPDLPKKTLLNVDEINSNRSKLDQTHIYFFNKRFAL